MNFWPFRRKPKMSINLHASVQRDATLAAAWTTYAGVKALILMGDYGKSFPDAREYDTPFGMEFHAREAMAEFWAAQPPEKQQSDPYLHLLADVYTAGWMREYVWQYLRDPSWPAPASLKMDGFSAWAAGKQLADHKPQTLAFAAAG